MENFKVDAASASSRMEIAKNMTIVSQKDIDDHYYFDDNGNAYKRCPLTVYEKRQRQDSVTTPLDENKTPCYVLFSSEGMAPAIVTKSGVDTRDKSVWFLSEKEALEAKSQKLSAKRKNLEEKLTKAEKNSKKDSVKNSESEEVKE